MAIAEPEDIDGLEHTGPAVMRVVVDLIVRDKDSSADEGSC